MNGQTEKIHLGILLHHLIALLAVPLRLLRINLEGGGKFPAGGGDFNVPAFPVENFLFVRIAISYLTWLSLGSMRG